MKYQLNQVPTLELGIAVSGTLGMVALGQSESCIIRVNKRKEFCWHHGKLGLS